MLLPSKCFDDRVAMIQSSDSLELTYSDVRSIVDRVSSAIDDGRHLGFVLAKNSIGSLLSYLVCVESRQIVPLMLDGNIDSSVLERLVEVYRPRYIFKQRDREPWNNYCKSVVSFANYELVDLGFTEAELFDDLGLLLTTSGSTGSSKFVRLSYSNIEANARSIVAYLELDEGERPITSLPMNYSYGLSVINSHLMCGATLLVSEESVMQKGFWTFARDRCCTSIAGVPYTYQMLRRIGIDKMDLPSLKTLTQAGGGLPTGLHRFFAEFAARSGRRFFVMYGQTEATARMSYLPWNRSIEKLGSIGIAIPGGEFDLVDDEGELIFDEGIEGELIYRGPNVSLGYAVSRDDLLKGDDNCGRLATGDMAKRDNEGFYFITGRKKRILKVFGKRISLDECEKRVAEAFSIDCACGGKDDQVVFYVEDKEREPQVRSFAVDMLRIHSSAIRVAAIEKIPRSDSGKISYKDLPTV